MKPFLHGKKDLAIASLRLPAGFATPACRTDGQAASGRTAPVSAVGVETVKEGDKVVRLIITCACGERIEIECLYLAGT